MLTDARFKFTLESLKKCTSMEFKNHIFFSPHLLYQNLLIMYLGTNDKTNKSLQKILYISDDDYKYDILGYYFAEGTHHFNYIMNDSSKSFTCRVYARFFINKRKQMNMDMNIYSSAYQLKEVNLDINPNRIKIFVNNIVKVVTQKYIQEILPPDSITKSTEAILFNVIYYKSPIDNAFARFDSISDMIVDCEEKDKKISQCKGLSEELDAYLLEIPCKSTDASVFFIFPISRSNVDSEKDKITRLVERLTTDEGSQQLRKILDNGLTESADMMHPTFNIQMDLDMHQFLDTLGLQEFTYSLGTGKLHNFSKYNIKFGEIVHRVVIEMTNTNITATAANLFLTNVNNGCEYPRIHDHIIDISCFSCVCLIYDKCHRNILFCGIILND